MKPVIFSPAAEQEFDDALAASRSPVKFQSVVTAALAAIAGNPQVAATIGRSAIRQYVLGLRIPYSLIYRDDPTRVTVIAFAHHKRRFGYWKRRLRKP